MFSFFPLTKNLIFSFSPVQERLASPNSTRSWQSPVFYFTANWAAWTRTLGAGASCNGCWKPRASALGKGQSCVFMFQPSACVSTGSNAEQESSSMSHSTNVMCSAYGKEQFHLWSTKHSDAVIPLLCLLAKRKTSSDLLFVKNPCFYQFLSGNVTPHTLLTLIFKEAVGWAHWFRKKALALFLEVVSFSAFPVKHHVSLHA